MAHHKKNKRRTGGIKGCCGMCMMYKYHCIHHRVETFQEKRSRLSFKEQVKELKDFG